MFISLKSLHPGAPACIIDKVDYLRWDGKLLLLIQVIPMEYVTIKESDDNPLKPAVSGRFFLKVLEWNTRLSWQGGWRT